MAMIAHLSGRPGPLGGLPPWLNRVTVDMVLLFSPTVKTGRSRPSGWAPKVVPSTGPGLVPASSGRPLICDNTHSRGRSAHPHLW